MGNWLVNHWFSAAVLAAWLGINIFLFTYYFLFFDRDERYFYTRAILGSALAWARASAKCLNFNSMLILLPVCRNLLSFLRGTCSCCRRTLRKQLDHNLTFHKLVAYALALLTAVHTIAHLFNLERYNQSQQATDGSLPAVLSEMHLQGSKWLNPIHSNQTTVEYVAFTTIPGLTGVIITLALILMVTSSTEFIRRNYFELFWYTHHLFLVYFAGLVIHGIAGLVRGQTEQSMAEVHPYHCAEYLTQREQNCTHSCCKDPEFGSIPAEVGQWWDGSGGEALPLPLGCPSFALLHLHSPGSGFLPPSSSMSLSGSCGSGVRTRRWLSKRWVVQEPAPLPAAALGVTCATAPRRGGHGEGPQAQPLRGDGGRLGAEPCPCPQVVMHPARVLELQMQKKGFCMEVGQYIFVNCPAISALEWHPFTLTSAPEEDFFSIHIRAAGDWTERLIDTFQLETPRIEVDGPFGTASEDVFQYEVAMLVGAGIGVTPFASILKSVWYKFQQADQTLKTKKIYFYWLCRDTGAFAWFNDLLASLEQKMAESGKADFLTYRLFLTGWDTSIANNVALHFDTATDTVTGLRHKTIFGRPMWNTEFAAVAAAHPRSVVGVFLCGPEALARSLQKSCHQHSSLDPRKVKFYFNKENF
ncbi:NADPH oxidase 1 isoform X1 [Motacilla alba alba]|uniref:NADPH oxidase 1 isoform X1 n=1 Tax=Motacilla alba alba TaxID=1094192 RepID=UPI0018D50237|nr:NADPH oxidase 1 isoform X1 [Motacilla alba alba]